jgi:glycosidase
MRCSRCVGAGQNYKKSGFGMQESRLLEDRNGQHAGHACPPGRPFRWAGVALSLLAILALAACQAGPPATAALGATGAAAVSVRPQRDWSDAVLYFVVLDRYADGDPTNNAKVDLANPGGWHGGDLKGLRAQLDEIADLGATAIWITPVVRQIDYCPIGQASPESGVKGSFEHCGFHGYWADDFESIDPHFGTEADLKALVAAAHARGIKVLLDVVYNHAGYGSHYLTDPRTAGWFRTERVECSVDALRCQVGGLPDFRTELPEVEDYLLNAHLGLASRTGLDGFRLDTVKHVEHAFWQRHRRETRARLGNGFFLLGEVWGGSATVLDEWFAGDELDAGFDFTFKGSCESFVQGKGRVVAFASYLEKRQQVRPGHYLAHYLSSHDEPLSLYNLKGDKAAFRLCVALQMTSEGIPTIYYGEEVARAGGVWPLNRSDMPWGSRNVAPGRGGARDEALRAYYKQLIALRRAHPALSAGGFRRLSSDGDLLVFERSDPAGADRVLVALNRGAAPAEAVVPAPDGWASGAGLDALSGERAERSGADIKISVPARAARIYVNH